MPTASELRARARRTLDGGIFAKGWLYALLVSLLISVIYGVASYTFVGVLILMGPLYIGQTSYYLAMHRRTKNQTDIGAAFDGFRGDFVSNMLSGMLVYVYTLLWSLLFIIPGIVKAYSYSMTYYIKCDHPEYTANEAITASRELMDGYKFKLFCLQLSFIGWIMISILTCGIGVLWVVPYMEAAQAAFYDELCRVKGGKFMPAPEAHANGEYGAPNTPHYGDTYSGQNMNYGNPNVPPYGNPYQSPQNGQNTPYENSNVPPYSAPASQDTPASNAPENGNNGDNVPSDSPQNGEDQNK